MRSRIAMAAMSLLLVELAGAQVVEQEVFLPDSFAGPRYPLPACIAGDRVKYYVGGAGGVPALVVVDAGSLVRIARVRLPESPQSLISGTRCIYAACRRRLVAVDVAADTVLAQLSVGDGPGIGVFETLSPSLYLANQLYGSVIKVDGISHVVVDTIPVQVSPVSMAWHAGQNKVYVAGTQGILAVIDAGADSVVAEVPVGPNPTALQIAGDFLYCSSRSASAVCVVDCRTDSVVATVPVGFGPVALAYDGRGKVYCANWPGNSASVIDCSTNRVIRTVGVRSPQALAYDPGLDRVYVGSSNDSLTVIDCGGDTIVVRVAGPVDCRHLEFDTGSGTLLAPGYGDGMLWLVRGDTVSACVQIAGSEPVAACVAGRHLFVAESRVDRLAVFSLPDIAPAGTVSLGASPRALCYDRRNNRVFCACGEADRVAIIDAATHEVRRWIDVGHAPTQLAYDAVGGKVYCGNYGSEELSVIDCAGESLVATVRVGRGTRRIIVNEPSRRVYVACHDSRQVFAVDASADTVVAFYGTDGNPWTLAWDRSDNLVYAGASIGMLVVDCAGDSLIGTVGQVFYPKGSCWSRQSNRVYVALNFSDELLVIDGASHEVVGQVNTAEYPAEMVAMPRNGRVYVCHTYSNVVTSQVTVVQDDSVLTVLAVQPSPASLVADTARELVFVLSPDASCLTVVRDGAGAVTGPEAGPRQEDGLGVQPSPFTEFTRISLGSGGAGAVVLDCAGRTVRTLDNDGDRKELTWDGADAQGRSVPAGVYFVRTGRVQRPLVKLR